MTTGPAVAVDEPGTTTAVKVVDTDVHPTVGAPEEFWEFIPERWNEYGPGRDALLRSMYKPPQDQRADARPDVGRPGSDPDLLERQLLHEAGVDYALMLPRTVRNYLDPELDADMHRASNDWMAATWLSRHNRHGRYKGTVRVSVLDPRRAAAEIEYWAGSPHIVAVQVGYAAPAAYGSGFFDPIWAAASRHGLPVVMHFDNVGLPPIAGPVGYVQTYMEYHAAGHPMAYSAHLVSMICSGTFERFPDLRFVFVEGGFAWVGSLVWRLDKLWRELRREVPALRLKPSEYVFRNTRFSSQPLEEIGRGNQLVDLFELMEADRLLLFSTDYPHWDFDNPSRVLLRLPRASRERIMFRNGCELYGLPTTRPI